MLNEPQHLAEIKTPKFLKIPNKGVTNLRERELKNNKLKLHENKLRVQKEYEGGRGREKLLLEI